MVTFFKVVAWVMATISGLLVWNILPETRAIISCGMVVAFICYGISIVVGVTVKRLIGDELLELRLQCNAVANRLELMDRKVTAILRDALEQRQAANLTAAVRTAPKHGHAEQRRFEQSEKAIACAVSIQSPPTKPPSLRCSASSTAMSATSRR
jgi:hypothetical protein